MLLRAKSKSEWGFGEVRKETHQLKSQYLSLGGRLTLINSVLDAPSPNMTSVIPMLASVSKSIDALRRNFVWQGSEDREVPPS